LREPGYGIRHDREIWAQGDGMGAAEEWRNTPFVGMSDKGKLLVETGSFGY